ncbi:CDP-glycerol glycerophosphotransferase family protein [Flavobacterium channae]|uniref:CDP-glycerol glycerophosphotransferase family protein n=1 Tax=Flavobacterium channae TaxID=2897181 RepID=UPI001E64DFB9|nr:CDP-glycerol glycerophosphotransferase family protein [Flavobacterium channae]UGS24215.1 CDP-glycerol glycerophosphotransferase family protein [Flavobacterium channae]
MKNSMKVMLLFPDGVGIRNYLYSDVFKGMEKELVLFHAFDAKTENAVKEISSIQNTISIPKYTESLKEKFLRELICLTRLKHNATLVNNATILTNWKSNHKGIFKTLFYKCIEIASYGFTSYERILKLERWYQKSIRKTSFYKEAREILVTNAPEKLFCSHQRGVQCAPIFAAAKDLGIETITVIYSWDNLPKARMALQADKYLVWSDYMKKELQLYYPEINENQIFVTGTPQFECYKQPENIIPKEVFYTRYNLDLDKKIICYSGDDVLTCPDDPQYLDDLADTLIKNKLDNKYQILLRRCPVDISGRFDRIISKYPNLIKQASPLWNFDVDSSWTTIYPLPDDVRLLVSTAYYCDVVVNLGSTMAFDFGMFKKPCIYINYDQKNKVNPNWSVNTIYKFQHFKSLPDESAVLWWNTKDEIKTLLENLNWNESTRIWIDKVLEEYSSSSTKVINSIFN